MSSLFPESNNYSSQQPVSDARKWALANCFICRKITPQLAIFLGGLSEEDGRNLLASKPITDAFEVYVTTRANGTAPNITPDDVLSIFKLTKDQLKEKIDTGSETRVDYGAAEFAIRVVQYLESDECELVSWSPLPEPVEEIMWKRFSVALSILTELYSDKLRDDLEASRTRFQALGAEVQHELEEQEAAMDRVCAILTQAEATLQSSYQSSPSNSPT
ncbi:hypothetical protein F5B20DRAFT_576073 [Whalleya microplaca]|nr:hypothetical protein F5B20DRAFT_576073 [Whalleya microplaca]